MIAVVRSTSSIRLGFRPKVEAQLHDDRLADICRVTWTEIVFKVLNVSTLN